MGSEISNKNKHMNKLNYNYRNLNFFDEGYLVSRGVRPLVLIGTCDTDPEIMFSIYNELLFENFGRTAGHHAIPFMIERDAYADFGYAQKSWVIDTYKWIIENAPLPHLHRLIGLLLGYSVDSIAEYDDEKAGRLFEKPNFE